MYACVLPRGNVLPYSHLKIVFMRKNIFINYCYLYSRLLSVIVFEIESSFHIAERNKHRLTPPGVFSCCAIFVFVDIKKSQRSHVFIFNISNKKKIVYFNTCCTIFTFKLMIFVLLNFDSTNFK